MEHIRQKDLSVYTVVIENGEKALTEHPEIFEKVEGEIPADAQFLIYE